MNRKFTFLTLITFLSTFIFSPSNLYSQDGSLDLTFGTNGKVITDIGGADDIGKSVAIQSDGKIVVAGFIAIGSKHDFAVVRYNSNGTLDPSFGNNGKVTTAVGDNKDDGFAVAIQSDGKILVAGTSNYNNDTQGNFALVRYNSDGTLDPTFDSDGKVTTTFGSGNHRAFAVTLQKDGKIVVAGYCFNGTDNDFALVRYNIDGTLDSSFDNDGKVTTAFGSGLDACYSIAILSDDKIVAAGYSYNGIDYDFAMAKYNNDGTLDPGFGTNGKVTTAIGSGNDYCNTVALQRDGYIILAGSSYNGSGNDFAVVRYNSGGNLDPNFGSAGKVTTAIGSENSFYSVVLQKDGKILAAGYTYNGTEFDFALVRYSSNGTLDQSFDNEGKLTTNFGNFYELGYSLAIQNDNNIVLAGISGNGSSNDFAVSRYTTTFTGLKDNLNGNFILDVYPNPASESLIVKVNGKLLGLNYAISNSIGKSIINGKLISEITRININALPSGIYFINVDGSNQNEFKIIKK